MKSATSNFDKAELNKLRMVFEQSPGAIFILDKQFRFEYVNPRFTSLSGYQKHELMGRTVAELFYRKDLPESRNEIVKSLQEGQKWEGELLTYNKDGSTYWANTIAAPYKNEIGQVDGYVIIQQDVSEKIAVEKALRESETKYKTLVEHSHDGILIVRNNKVLYANDTICNMLGYCVGGELLFSTKNMIHPDDQLKMMAIGEKRRSGDKSTIHESIRLIAKDGSVKECDSTSTMIMFEGEWAAFYTIHDRTESNRMQRELTESEEKYKTLIENSQDGVFAIEGDSILFANRTFCKMIGYSSEELYAKSAQTLVYAEDREKGLAISLRRRNGDYSTVNDIFRLRTRDGQLIEADIFSSVVDLNNKKVSLITVHDLTEIKRMKNELEIAKNELEILNSQLEKRVKDSTKRLTEARTQLINLQKENLQSQYEVLKQQVNPHFLFNSLNVLTSLIKLEPDLAEKFSEQLSKVYRYVLENKDNELVDLQTELNFLDAYIFLLNIRFIDKLKVNIDIPTHRRSDRIIPLAMQLLIENAIKHNTMSKSEPLMIDIFIDKDNNLNIINNLQERPSQLVSTGVGLKNIQNRYQLLNNTKPVFEKTADHFIAKVPLVLTVNN